MDVGGEPDAVAHGDHHVLEDDDPEGLLGARAEGGEAEDRQVEDTAAHGLLLERGV